MTSGYQGEDSMRKKAELMFGKTMGGGTSDRESFSGTSHDKPRLFKKGGNVKQTSEMRKSMKGRTKSKVHDPKLNIESGSEMKRMKKGGKDCYALGGVGKIRHNQSDMHGNQINRRVDKSK